MQPIHTRLIYACMGLIPLLAHAEITDMPKPDDFKIGDAWQWRQVDDRTKLEERILNRVVIEKDHTLLFKDENTEHSIATYFIGSNAAMPWRLWPLEVGKKWTYDENWTRTDGVSGNTHQQVEVVSYEKINLSIGTFSTFKIEYRGSYQNSRGSSGKQIDIYWYSPQLKQDIKHTRNDGYNMYTREMIHYKTTSSNQ
ncbi:hypothetical protein [Chromobacterium vaccinii]|uniref:hypothetical protein n=1 Tax=Chromobacterium vaccinii TaxID=1108595 RepID=UPI001E2EAA8A|nr:hypothetical protein [Chromobacterium vaccinii]MCD4499361.1 hypothetical protein [Chromobacterium vaccinii]